MLKYATAQFESNILSNVLIDILCAVSSYHAFSYKLPVPVSARSNHWIDGYKKQVRACRG